MLYSGHVRLSMTYHGIYTKKIVGFFVISDYCNISIQMTLYLTQAMDITADKIALRNADFYSKADITILKQKQVETLPLLYAVFTLYTET